MEEISRKDGSTCGYKFLAWYVGEKAVTYRMPFPAFYQFWS